MASVDTVITKLESASEATRLRVVTSLIRTLESDTSIDEVWAMAKATSRELRTAKARHITGTLREGDRVVVSNIRPKGLDGMHAIVVATPVPGAKRVECRWDDPVEFVTSRSRNGSLTRLPASCLTKES